MPDTPDPATAPRHVLAADLTRAANTDGRRAAVTLIVGYNDGELLDDPTIRQHLHTTTTGTMVRWHSIANLIHEPRASAGLGLGDTAEGILSLACALTVGTPCQGLARTLSQASDRNAPVILAALTAMLGTPAAPWTIQPDADGAYLLPTPTRTVATGGWAPLADQVRAAAGNTVNVVTLPGLLDDVARTLAAAGPDGATAAQIVARLRPAHDTDRNTVAAALAALAADPDSTRGGYPTQPAPHGPYIWVSNGSHGRPATGGIRETDVREAVADEVTGAGAAGATIEEIVGALDGPFGLSATADEVFVALVALTSAGEATYSTRNGARWYHADRKDTTTR